MISQILVSAGIVLALALARNASFGFPLHPIGYAFPSSYAMEYISAVVLLTWLIKTLVVRYGGLQALSQVAAVLLRHDPRRLRHPDSPGASSRARCTWAPPDLIWRARW